MTNLFCENDHRVQSRHLCVANDCNFARARRRFRASRVCCPGITGNASLSLKTDLHWGQRSHGSAVCDQDRRRAQWTFRTCLSWSLRPEKWCCDMGPGAVTAGRGQNCTASQADEIFRPQDLALRADYRTSRCDSGGTARNLEMWFRSLSCTFIAIILSFPQLLGAESLPLSDCNDLLAYYGPLHGLEGHDLKTRLHDIIKDHQVLPYIQVWDALKVLDEAGDDPDSVIEIYSSKKVAKNLQAHMDGWNREHLWPRSYGLVLGRPEFTDLQNLRPSDVNVNSSRGNKVFGECTMSLSDQCLVPANKEAAPDTGANKDIWMPPAQVRGDIARALMYMAVRYGSDQPTGSQQLQLSDTPSVGNARMGRLSDLLHWNEIDPPSDAEKLRNSRVCSLYQHNRNPFVDHPEYAKLIWGVSNAKPSTQKVHSAASPMDEKTDAWINEFHYDNEGVDQDEFVEVAVGPTVNSDSLTVVLYNGAGRAYRSIPLQDGTIFSKGSDVSSGFSIFVAKLSSGTLRNGPRDALALVQEDGSRHLVNVLQFLSYGGTLMALDGPAEGLQSSDIRVKEGSKTPLGSSLGLRGSGQSYKDFQWSETRAGASPGSWNLGQTLLRAFRQLGSKLPTS